MYAHICARAGPSIKRPKCLPCPSPTRLFQLPLPEPPKEGTPRGTSDGRAGTAGGPSIILAAGDIGVTHMLNQLECKTFEIEGVEPPDTKTESGVRIQDLSVYMGKVTNSSSMKTKRLRCDGTNRGNSQVMCFTFRFPSKSRCSAVL